MGRALVVAGLTAAMGGALVVAAPAGAAHLDAPTVVNVTDLTAAPNLVENEGTGGTVEIGNKADLIHHDGSLHLKTTSDATGHPQVTLNNGSAASLLSAFTTGAYDVFDVTGHVATYQLPTWCDGNVSSSNDTHFVTFFYVPSDNAGTVIGGVWQTISGLAAGTAKWEPTRYVLKNGTTSSTAPSDASTIALTKGAPTALSDIKAACTAGKTTGPKLNLGSGEPSSEDFVDNVVFNNTVTNFKLANAAAPTLNLTLPAALGSPTQAAPVTFDGSIVNPAGGIDYPLVTGAFTITPAQADATLTPTSLHVEVQNGQNWDPVTLTAGSGGSLTGSIGPASGFPLPIGTITLHFRTWVDPGVNGNNLSVGAALASPNPNAAIIVANTFNTTLAGPQNDCPATLGNGATVRLAYGRYLSRCADSGGYAYWVGRMASGGTVGDLSFSFAESPENIGTQVSRAMQTMLGRPADAGGVAYWTGQILTGLRYDSFLGALADSPEFFQKHSDVSAAVDTMYLTILGRHADDGGLAYYGQQLATGAMGPDDIVEALFLSQESLQKTVNAIYQQVLARGPDAGGLQFWTNALAFTGAPFWVEGQIGASPEFVLQAQAFPNIPLS